MNEQAIQCALEQAALDMPSVEVLDTAIYRKIIIDDLSHDAPGDHWYVEVTLRHREDESTAMALYRVWRSTEGLKAIRVTMAILS